MKTLGVSEAADILKVHENRILELAGSGEIPGAKIGRAWVFIDEDLFEYVRRKIKEQSSRRAFSPKRGRQIATPKVGVPHQHL